MRLNQLTRAMFGSWQAKIIKKLSNFLDEQKNKWRISFRTLHMVHPQRGWIMSSSVYQLTSILGYSGSANTPLSISNFKI
jgi:hypothetical protein